MRTIITLAALAIVAAVALLALPDHTARHDSTPSSQATTQAGYTAPDITIEPCAGYDPANQLPNTLPNACVDQSGRVHIIQAP